MMIFFLGVYVECTGWEFKALVVIDEKRRYGLQLALPLWEDGLLQQLCTSKGGEIENNPDTA